MVEIPTINSVCRENEKQNSDNFRKMVTSNKNVLLRKQRLKKEITVIWDFLTFLPPMKLVGKI